MLLFVAFPGGPEKHAYAQTNTPEVLLHRGPQQNKSDPYIVRSLPLNEEIAMVYPFDLDGDQKKELLVLEGNQDRRGWFLRVMLYSWAENRPQPRQVAVLPPGTSIVGVGHFRSGPALVFAQREQVYFYPWHGDVFDENAYTPLPAAGVAPVRLKRALDYPLMQDLNADGFDEVVLPTMYGVTIWSSPKEGGLRQLAKLRTPATGSMGSLGYVPGRILVQEIPAVHFVQVDGKGWKDALLFNDDRISVHLLDAQGVTELSQVFDLQPLKPFTPKLPKRFALHLAHVEDLNGDGRPDLVLAQNIRQDGFLDWETEISIYYGRSSPTNALMFLEKSDQSFSTDGVILPIVRDLDGDGKPDLGLVSLSLSVWTILQSLASRSVSGEVYFYRMQANGRYGKRPDKKESFSVNLVLTQSTRYPVLKVADVNGDKLPDLLLSRSSTRLAIHLGRKGEFWDSSPDHTVRVELPLRLENVRDSDMDGDGSDDLILIYQRQDIRLLPQLERKLGLLFSRFP